MKEYTFIKTNNPTFDELIGKKCHLFIEDYNREVITGATPSSLSDMAIATSNGRVKVVTSQRLIIDFFEDGRHITTSHIVDDGWRGDAIVIHTSRSEYVFTRASE